MAQQMLVSACTDERTLTFTDLDSSGDGKLSHQELEQALVELDINITTVQAHALVTFMGENYDGVRFTMPVKVHTCLWEPA